MKNAYILIARTNKAHRLCEVLYTDGIKAADLQRCAPYSEIWWAAAQKAGVHIPHSDETRAMVLEFLRAKEAKQ